MKQEEHEQLTRITVMLEALQADMTDVKTDIKSLQTSVKSEYVTKTEFGYVKDSVKNIWIVISSIAFTIIGLIINAIAGKL